MNLVFLNHMYTKLSNYISILRHLASAVARWVKAFAPQAEGREFESRPRQTLVVVKTGSDSSTAKRSALSNESVMGPRR